MAVLTDIHCHGGGGYAFGESVEGSLAAAAAHRATGTHELIGSFVSLPPERMRQQLAVMRDAMAQDPSILGVHLEGPFLSPQRKGAHDETALATPTPDAVSALLDEGAGVVRQITIAPELPGALEAIERLAAAGITVAVGHTQADAALAREAFDAGARLVTHAFNAMRGIEAREVGPAGAALADERVALEVIADGIHVDTGLIAALFRAAPGRVVLVTDAMAAAASADGDYVLGSLPVEVRDGRAVIAGTQTLAGSTLTLTRAIEVCVEAGVPHADAHAAASAVPRRVLGLD